MEFGVPEVIEVEMERKGGWDSKKMIKMKFEIPREIDKEVQKKDGWSKIKKPVLSDHPLTAKEISKQIDYAYTTTINAPNRSRGLGYIRLSHFLEILEETEKSIKQLDGGYMEKLKCALKTVDNAIQILKKLEEVEVGA